jgi:dTDP-glucose pyrophosphorylase
MSKPIDIVITMAGAGKRFREAGYTLPKYQIEARGKTLFEWSMLSLDGYRELVRRYIFIVLREDAATPFIKEQGEKLRLPNITVVELDEITDGQATTAMMARKYWDNDDALLIYNIDTYVEPGQMNAAELKGDGFIPCFRGEGNHWSFVRLDKDGRAVEVREKFRVSDYCTLGAYYFSSCELYASLYQGYGNGEIPTVNNEKYIAPLYNLLIARGGSVYISDVDSKYVHVLGTPEELEAFVNGQ